MGLFRKIRQFLNEVKVEMSKVSWPTFDELKGSTWIVIALSLAFALYIFVIDQALSWIIRQLY